MSLSNRHILFTTRPAGKPTPEIFAAAEKPLIELQDGEFRIRNHYIAMDPALVGRMRTEDNYAESVAPGDVMHAYGVGEVIESKNPSVQVGQTRLGRLDMQEYYTSDDPSTSFPVGVDLPISWYLSVLGITGITAYFAFHEICEPKEGETVVISAGASSVGATVAQLAKKVGCRTVGIVSTDEKAQQAKEEWDYDAVVSYRGKSIDELSQAIGEVCPNGVDMYYDNTSGDISEAVMDHYNLFARIAVVGRLAISHLSDTKQDTGRRDNNLILARRVKKQGFVILDYKDRMLEAIIALAELVQNGDIKVKEDILEGIDKTSEAFFRMLNGENNGKQLVKLI